jgi:beta-lactamase class A
VPAPISRRALLGAAAILALPACSREETPAGPEPVPTPSGPPLPSPSATQERRHPQLTALERRYGARLGVYAVAIGTGATVAHRADERFAFCSTFKGLAAAAVLAGNPLSHLNTLVRYSEADLMAHAPITRRRLARGMTIRQLCDAAVRYSDGTAGNLLLRDLGGPDRLTAYLRDLGDRVTRMDRIEPAITTARPGDPRDTTSPRAIGTDYRRIVLEDALPDTKREFLRDLLERNTTGGRRIRAGLPRGWTAADKTGSGDYGTANDIAVVWPPNSPPLLISIMSSKPAKDAEYDEALIAHATRYVVATLS